MHDTALRNGDDLHARPGAATFACRQHAVNPSKPTFEIDVDMGAQMRGAACQACLDQIAGALLGGDRQVRQEPFVRLEPAHPHRSRASR